MHTAITKTEIDLKEKEVTTELGLKIASRATLHTLVNGYRTKDAIGQSVKELTLLHTTVVTHEYLLKTLKELHEKMFTGTMLEVFSYSLVLHCVANDIAPQHTNMCLIDVTHEATEMSIVRDGELTYVTHTPFGLYSLARELSEITKAPLEETLGYLRAPSSKFLASLPAKQAGEAEIVLDAYTEKLSELFSQTGDDLAIPRQLVLHTESTTEDFITEILRKVTKRLIKADPVVIEATSLLFKQFDKSSKAAISDTALLVGAHFSTLETSALQLLMNKALYYTYVSKWNLQDIRPVERKQRRPVPPPTRIDDDEPVDYEQPVRPPTEGLPKIIIQDGTKKGKSAIFYAVVAFFVIVGGAVTLSALLGKTELTIYPEYREPNINTDFTAYPDKRPDALSYEILTLESTSESQVAASGQVQVQEQATGLLEIVKTTPGTERLIKNTRFRTPDGLVFRIQESVVVPGAVTDSSGASVPGTIQAEVFADEVGEEYNISSGVRFDIPGFQESGLTDLYDAIYAQSNQSFSGGFDGPQFQIDDSELQTARQLLQQKLRDDLLTRVDTERPAGFITFPGATAITYNQLQAVEYGDDLVTIREQAVLQIPLFKADDFGEFIAGQAVATYSGGPVRIEDPSQLIFSYTSPTTSASTIANETSLNFNITGKPLLVWEYDVEKLKRDLAGLPKTAVNNAISAYPGIEGARVSITPFWKRTFPAEVANIEIVEELRT